MITTSIRADVTEKIMAEYIKKLQSMTPLELIAELFTYFEYIEESDSGRVFHPVCISNCRVLLHEPMEALLSTMKDRIGEV